MTYFVYTTMVNERTGSCKFHLVTSFAFNDSTMALFVNDVRLCVDEVDYLYAKDTLLRCILSGASIIHEDILTDGNASRPTFDPVYESIEIIKGLSG